MNCNQAHDLMIDLIYEETGPETRKALEQHLEYCPDCASAFASLKQVRQMCRDLTDPQPSTMTINRILARAREEAEQRRSFWGFGWAKVLSMVCVVVIAGSIVVYQSQPGWFQEEIPAAMLDTAPAEPAANRSVTLKATRSAPPIQTAAVTTSTQAKTAEVAAPPVGIITTGTSSSVHPQGSSGNGGQVRVSFSMHRALPISPPAPSVSGSDGNSGLKARSPAISYHAVNNGAFTIETYISGNRPLDMAMSDGASPDMLQAENFQPRIIQIDDEFQPDRIGPPSQLRLASRGIRLEPADQETKTIDASGLDEKGQSLDIAYHLEEGRAAFNAGLFKQAIDHLEQSIHLMSAGDPQRAHALNHLALAYEKIGAFGRAESLYREIVSTYPHLRETAEQRLHTLAAE